LSRRAVRAPFDSIDHPRHEVLMSDHPSVLEGLQARFDAITISRSGAGGSWNAHVAILDRLASNRRGAESAGWTQCALERDGGMGRLRLFGLPPGDTLRTEVPDPG
jgi:hypothetical protein